MVDISSGDKKINITVSTSGNKASVNATPDTAMYYSNKSREWAISDKIVSNEDYSSKYYANVSKQNADKSTVTFENLTTNYNEYKTDLENTKNISVEEIETAKTNAISDITNQETLSVDNVNTAGETQVNLAKEQATIATTQAGIATSKTSEVVESGNNAIIAITEQETTSKNNIETKGTEQIELIQNEGATQVANVQSTGFYMRDDKLYYINSQGEETEFKSGGSGLEIGDIGMALYVDESKGLRRYLNGQVVDRNDNTEVFFTRLQEITTLHPSLLCTEDEWQTAKTMSAFGQVGKFVFNYADDGETVVSVRIPRVVNVQGLFDLQNLGMTVSAGLPDHNHSTHFAYSNVSFSGGGGGATDFIRPRNAATNVASTNASASNPIYGNSDTVQPEAIQYPYFIQIATGSETENNIVNDIELNNPYSLFDSKYSDHELNNLSWLKSEGQWNAKSVYTDAYDKLLKVYNGTETVEGLSVKLSTEEYTDYDFVLNTADETFRLPLLDGSEDLPSAKRYVYELPTSKGQKYTALYNGIIQLNATSSATNQYVSLINSTTGEYDEMRTPSSGVSNVCNIQVKAGDTFTVHGDNMSTINWLANIKYVGNGSLYYYVGETVQNANLIDAGRIGEQLANKQDKCIHIIDTYVNGTSGYRIWSDGYCEQWGAKAPSNTSWKTISLLKTYKNKDYLVMTSCNGNVNGTGFWSTSTNGQAYTTNSIQILGVNADSSWLISWKTCGYLAEGEY